MTNFFKTTAMAAAATAGMLAAVPATAATAFGGPVSIQTSNESWNQYRYRDDYRDRGYRGNRDYYGEPVHRNSRVWRGRDNRYYCKRSNGTTGLIVGGALGALLGREIDGGYNRSTGTILGAAGGALLGRSVDRNKSRCR
jgi:hypothetical protein